jgi:hypothetical protein
MNADYLNVRRAVERKGYAFFENGSFNLNIIGVRSLISLMMHLLSYTSPPQGDGLQRFIRSPLIPANTGCKIPWIKTEQQSWFQDNTKVLTL